MRFTSADNSIRREDPADRDSQRSRLCRDRPAAAGGRVGTYESSDRKRSARLCCTSCRICRRSIRRISRRCLPAKDDCEWASRRSIRPPDREPNDEQIEVAARACWDDSFYAFRGRGRHVARVHPGRLVEHRRRQDQEPSRDAGSCRGGRASLQPALRAGVPDAEAMGRQRDLRGVHRSRALRSISTGRPRTRSMRGFRDVTTGGCRTSNAVPELTPAEAAPPPEDEPPVSAHRTRHAPNRISPSRHCGSSLWPQPAGSRGAGGRAERRRAADRGRRRGSQKAADDSVVPLGLRRSFARRGANGCSTRLWRMW